MLDKITQSLQQTYQTFQFIRYSNIICFCIECFHFTLGGVGIHHLIQSYDFNNRAIEEYPHPSLWLKKTWKIADLLGNLSLIVNGIKSWPALVIWKWNIQKILSPQQLQLLFGFQGTIPGEKIYNIMSLVSFLMGIPSTLKTIYLTLSQLHRHYSLKDHPYPPLKNDRYEYMTPVKKTQIVVTMKIMTETAYKFIPKGYYKG